MHMGSNGICLVRVAEYETTARMGAVAFKSRRPKSAPAEKRGLVRQPSQITRASPSPLAGANLLVRSGLFPSVEGPEPT